MTEMKNAFDGLTSRLDTAEERNSVLQDITIDSSKTKKQKEQRNEKTEQNIQGLWDNYKECNKHIMKIPEGERNKRNI